MHVDYLFMVSTFREIPLINTTCKTTKFLQMYDSRGYCDDVSVFVLTALKFALLVYPRKISRPKCVS